MTASFIFKSYEDNKKNTKITKKKHKMLKKFLKHKREENRHTHR